VAQQALPATDLMPAAAAAAAAAELAAGWWTDCIYMGTARSAVQCQRLQGQQQQHQRHPR
jgi:hypothetical protein